MGCRLDSRFTRGHARIWIDVAEAALAHLRLASECTNRSPGSHDIWLLEIVVVTDAQIHNNRLHSRYGTSSLCMVAAAGALDVVDA